LEDIGKMEKGGMGVFVGEVGGSFGKQVLYFGWNIKLEIV